jgi:putative membrane-bound dehydrogenase-like protein
LIALTLLAFRERETQAQLKPDQALTALTPAEGLQVQLFAHEDQLVCPTAFDIDEKGRVWVAEGVNYRAAAGPKTPEPPYYLKPLRKTGDRIVVLEDTKGTGKCDSARVFYEGLDINSPQGFAVIGDKVWISQSPNIVTIEIKPDGTAGKKETVLTGFNGIHSDHSVHSLTMGPDGKLYGTFGDTGCDTKFPDGRRLITNGKPWRGGCAFRMNYDLSGAEIIAHNFRNGYECAVDSFGTAFMSDNDEDEGNQFCRVVAIMEGGNYGWNPYQKGFDWNLESPGVVPILMRTGAGAPAGMCVYEGKLLPEKYRGMPVLAECGAGWVGCFRLSPDSAGYRVAGAAVNAEGRQTSQTLSEIRKPDILLSSSDRWFRPSDVAVAPDGSLFVADFYNHIAGGRNQSEPPRGRIYRLIPKGHDGTYRTAAPDVTTADGLLAALGSPNLATRARAILRIKELGPKAVEALAPQAKSADRFLRARVLYQLGTLGSEGQKHVRAALKDADPDFRIVAIRSLRQNGADMVEVAQALQKDPALQVRRELLLALRETDPATAREVLVALANQYDGHDRYYLEAVGIAFRGRETTLTPALIQSWPKGEWNRRVAGLLWVLGAPEALPTSAAIAADKQRAPADRQIAIEALGGINDIKAGEALVNLLGEDNKAIVRQALPLLTRKAAWQWRGLGRNPDAHAFAEQLVKDPELRQDAIAFSRALGTRPLTQWMLSQPFISPKGSGFAKSHAPEKLDKPELQPDWTRGRTNADGIIDLASQRSPKTESLAYAATLLNTKEAYATRLWIGSSAGIQIWLNGELVHTKQEQRDLAPRAEAVMVTLNQGINRLLVKCDSGAKDWGFIVELMDPHGRVAEITDQSLPKISAPPSERLDPRKLPPDRELLAVKGDAGRGRQVFLRSKAGCATCHKIKGEGGELGIGPALDGVAVKMSREALLAKILRPSQSILGQYYAWTIETKNGLISTGIIAEESPERLVLRDLQGKSTTIAKQDIVERIRSDVSPMPELLIGELSRQDLADLLNYLVELK